MNSFLKKSSFLIGAMLFLVFTGVTMDACAQAFFPTQEQPFTFLSPEAGSDSQNLVYSKNDNGEEYLFISNRLLIFSKL